MPKPSSFTTGWGKFLNPVRCLLSKRGKYLKSQNIEANIQIFFIIRLYKKLCRSQALFPVAS